LTGLPGGSSPAIFPLVLSAFSCGTSWNITVLSFSRENPQLKTGHLQTIQGYIIDIIESKKTSVAKVKISSRARKNGLLY
jgi:hypothetical protein